MKDKVSFTSRYLVPSFFEGAIQGLKDLKPPGKLFISAL